VSEITLTVQLKEQQAFNFIEEHRTHSTIPGKAFAGSHVHNQQSIEVVINYKSPGGQALVPFLSHAHPSLSLASQSTAAC
jgi:hypothetical protein